MFSHFKITHSSGESKLIDINEYNPVDLNVISEFYSNLKNYRLERI